MFGWYSLWVMHSVPEHQQRERKAEEKKKRRRNCDSVVGLAKKDMSCSKALASTYINTKSSKREIAMNLSHLFSIFFLAPFNLRSTFTRFHIFSLGAMMLLLFIRCVVLSPSSSNIYAFYFLRHLFFFTAACFVPIRNCIISYFPTDSCPLHLRIRCDYFDQLFFGDTNIVITFDSCVCVCVSYFFSYLVIFVHHFVGVHVIFIYLFFIWIICPIWIWIRVCIGILSKWNAIFCISSQIVDSGFFFLPSIQHTIFHINLLFLSIYLTCYSNVSRKCVSDFRAAKAHSKNRKKSSTSIPI